MANGVDDLTTRVQVVDEKVDRVSTALDQFAVSVDERFNAVDMAIREQREYTEFAFSQLEARLVAKMDAGFGHVEAKTDRLEGKIDAGLGHGDAKMDAGFGRVERRLDLIVDALLPRRNTKKKGSRD